MPEPTVDQPLVYHLYGYPDEPDSLVITEYDLIDFLAAVIRNVPPLSPFIRASLSRPENTCLFIDLGFKNWYLRVLLRALQLHGHTEMSVALEEPEFFAQSRQHQTIVYFSASRTIQFRQDSLNEFARNLRLAHGWREEAARRPAEPTRSAAPRVFLSYANEDKGAVERLAEGLGNGGIFVWQDDQSLRAGDNWDRLLVQVINKQVDYVVVVQTPAMARRTEGYFYKEIAEALERQKRMAEGIRFLLPVETGGASVLPQLGQLHSVPVNPGDPGGVSALLRSTLDTQRLYVHPHQSLSIRRSAYDRSNRYCGARSTAMVDAAGPTRRLVPHLPRLLHLFTGSLFVASAPARTRAWTASIWAWLGTK